MVELLAIFVLSSPLWIPIWFAFYVAAEQRLSLCVLFALITLEAISLAMVTGLFRYFRHAY